LKLKKTPAACRANCSHRMWSVIEKKSV
jgi:hypothetical protein